LGRDSEETGLLNSFMTRREFSAALAGVTAIPPFVCGSASAVIILEAIAGSRLPATLAITTNSPEKLRRGLWELRTYRGAAPAMASHLASVFRRVGIRPLLQDNLRQKDGENLTYFVPFENLTARDRAWTAVSADPQWISARTQFQSYHFGLYRSV
jgi:hypothetical protein